LLQTFLDFPRLFQTFLGLHGLARPLSQTANDCYHAYSLPTNLINHKGAYSRMKTLVLLRHGESVWNRENRFTGWTDVDLSEKGIEEALSAGTEMKIAGYKFDIAYTSVLKRAIKTLNLALDQMDLDWIPVAKAWRLNERHYGALQGLNKAEIAEIHGLEQTNIWRRSYDVPPPALPPDDPRHPGRDPRYASLSQQELPLTECLKDTVTRFLPYWHEVIAPALG